MLFYLREHAVSILRINSGDAYTIVVVDLKITNLLRNRKVAVVLVLLLAFGAGLSSMLYENPMASNVIEDSPRASIGGKYPKPIQVGIAPQEPALAPMPAPIPAPQVITKEVIKEVPKEVIREVPKQFGNAISLQQPFQQDRMVISTASIGLNVTSVALTVAELRRIAEVSGGFITDSFMEPIPKGMSVAEGVLIAPSARASVTMRVPSDQLDRTIAQITSLGKLISYATNSRDVTEQYVDLNARLKNQQAVLEQYKEILKSARLTSDILAVQQRIDYVQEQIEVLTAQIKRLQNQSTYSTIVISLIEPQIVEKPKKEEQNLLDRLLIQPLTIAFSLAEIEVRGLLILIVGLLPLYPIMGAGYIAYRKHSGRAKRDN